MYTPSSGTDQYDHNDSCLRHEMASMTTKSSEGFARAQLLNMAWATCCKRMGGYDSRTSTSVIESGRGGGGGELLGALPCHSNEPSS